MLPLFSVVALQPRAGANNDTPEQGGLANNAAQATRNHPRSPPCSGAVSLLDCIQKQLEPLQVGRLLRLGETK